MHPHTPFRTPFDLPEDAVSKASDHAAQAAATAAAAKTADGGTVKASAPTDPTLASAALGASTGGQSEADRRAAEAKSQQAAAKDASSAKDLRDAEKAARNDRDAAAAHKAAEQTRKDAEKARKEAGAEANRPLGEQAYPSPTSQREDALAKLLAHKAKAEDGSQQDKTRGALSAPLGSPASYMTNAVAAPDGSTAPVPADSSVDVNGVYGPTPAQHAESGHLRRGLSADAYSLAAGDAHTPSPPTTVPADLKEGEMRLVDSQGKTVDNFHDTQGAATMVTVQQNVYEEFVLPGTDRSARRLKYRKGQQVALSALQSFKAQVNATETAGPGGTVETK